MIFITSFSTKPLSWTKAASQPIYTPFSYIALVNDINTHHPSIHRIHSLWMRRRPPRAKTQSYYWIPYILVRASANQQHIQSVRTHKPTSISRALLLLVLLAEHAKYTDLNTFRARIGMCTTDDACVLGTFHVHRSGVVTMCLCACVTHTTSHS